MRDYPSRGSNIQEAAIELFTLYCMCMPEATHPAPTHQKPNYVRSCSGAPAEGVLRVFCSSACVALPCSRAPAGTLRRKGPTYGIARREED